jgi:hypothetical protein
MVKKALEGFLLLLQLLTQVIIEIQRKRRESSSRDRQEKADAAKADIASAFNNHFGGVRDDTGDNANSSDKAGNQGKG